MTWVDDEAVLEHAHEVLSERCPGKKSRSLPRSTSRTLHGNSTAKVGLHREDGVPELVTVNQTTGDERSVREILEVS